MSKAYPAIAAIEFSDIPSGVFAMDAMVKKAPIAALKSGIVSPGRYLTLIGGSTASVEEAYAAGLAAGEGKIHSQVFLPDVHPALHDGILGGCTPPGHDAIAVLETPDVCSNLLAVEKALKGVEVGLVEIRLADSLLAGKAVAILHGTLHDIQSAVDLAQGELAVRNLPMAYRILTAPHSVTANALGGDTRFGESELLKLEDAEEAE